MYIRGLFARNKMSILRVQLAGEHTPIVADANGSRVYLAHLIRLAMSDGMTRLGLGIDGVNNVPWMQFFGPFCHDTPMWFDLTPPGAYFYPMALQVCIQLAHLEPTLPIRGTIPAITGRKRFTVNLEVHELNSFQLSWNAELCERWRETVEPYTGDGDRPRGVAAIGASND